MVEIRLDNNNCISVEEGQQLDTTIIIRPTGKYSGDQLLHYVFTYTYSFLQGEFRYTYLIVPVAFILGVHSKMGVWGLVGQLEWGSNSEP